MPPRTEADQWILASGRNLHFGGGYLDLSLSCRGFQRRHDGLLAVGAAGCSCGQSLLPESLAGSWSSPPARDQCRRQSVLSEGDHGTEAGAQVRLPLSLPYLSLLEQHGGARPSGDQTAGEREPRIPILRGGVANDS